MAITGLNSIRSNSFVFIWWMGKLYKTLLELLKKRTYTISGESWEGLTFSNMWYFADSTCISYSKYYINWTAMIAVKTKRTE